MKTRILESLRKALGGFDGTMRPALQPVPVGRSNGLPR